MIIQLGDSYILFEDYVDVLYARLLHKNILKYEIETVLLEHYKIMDEAGGNGRTSKEAV